MDKATPEVGDKQSVTTCGIYSQHTLSGCASRTEVLPDEHCQDAERDKYKEGCGWPCPGHP